LLSALVGAIMLGKKDEKQDQIKKENKWLTEFQLICIYY
jgi:hypothetical protein